MPKKYPIKQTPAGIKLFQSIVDHFSALGINDNNQIQSTKITLIDNLTNYAGCNGVTEADLKDIGKSMDKLSIWIKDVDNKVLTKNEWEGYTTYFYRLEKYAEENLIGKFNRIEARSQK